MDDAVDGLSVFFTHRIEHFLGRGLHLARTGDDLPAHGAVGVFWVDQIKKIGSYGHRQLILGKKAACAFLGS